MKTVSYCLFVFLANVYNVERVFSIPPRYTLKLDRNDRRREHATLTETERFMTDEFRDTHVAIVGVGSPVQYNFHLQFSTGTNRSWIFADTYNFCSPLFNLVNRTHKIFNMSKSRTSYNIDTDDAKYFQDGKDWALGFTAKDVLTIVAPRIELIPQTFLSLAKASEKFTYGKPDGVLSLQYDPEIGADNFVARLCGVESKFSFYYPRKKATRPDSSTGQFLLCGIDETRFVPGTMLWTDDNKPGFWQIQVQTVTVLHSNGTYANIASPTMARFDTGTDRISGPQSYVEEIYKNIFATQIPNYPDNYEIACDRMNSAPKVHFTIDGETYQLYAYDYILKSTYPDKREYCEVLFKKSSNAYWTLGDTFLRATFVVFDITNSRIGIAQTSNTDLPT